MRIGWWVSTKIWWSFLWRWLCYYAIGELLKQAPSLLVIWHAQYHLVQGARLAGRSVPEFDPSLLPPVADYPFLNLSVNLLIIAAGVLALKQAIPRHLPSFPASTSTF